MLGLLLCFKLATQWGWIEIEISLIQQRNSSIIMVNNTTVQTCSSAYCTAFTIVFYNFQPCLQYCHNLCVCSPLTRQIIMTNTYYDNGFSINNTYTLIFTWYTNNHISICDLWILLKRKFLYQAYVKNLPKRKRKCIDEALNIIIQVGIYYSLLLLLLIIIVVVIIF